MMTESNIFGEPEPIFGGATLPNDLEMTNREYGWCNQIVRVLRLTRRAVGTGVRQLFRLNLFAQLETLSLQVWPTLGQRLGAPTGFDQTQGQHPSRISRKPGNRSGASPHQSTLMTKTKTFVPYFRYPIVFL
jgi:hypothetical protein